MLLPLDHGYEFNGQRVAWGKIGAGEPMVLIHGTPFSSQVWRKIGPLLARRHSVYYFDLLGYGQSEMKAGVDVSLGVQNALLAALLAEWQLNRPEVLCHDFGAATVLRGYYLNGLRYSKVTLFDAVALAPWGSPFVQHVRRHEEAFAGLPAYAHDALLKAYIQGSAHRLLSDEAMTIYTEPWQGQTGQAAFYRQIAQMDQKYTDEIEPRYAALDCPVSLLWGERDGWIPISQGERLGERLHVPLQRIADCGHLMQEDAPEAVVAAVLG